jgi:thioredoxin reductase (NADPH)
MREPDHNPNFHGAGEVVTGWNSHAMSEGGAAATTLRNDLAEKRPLRR